MTDLFAKGKLDSQVGKYPAIIPEVSGKAYITGFYQFVAEPDDPFKSGFLLL